MRSPAERLIEHTEEAERLLSDGCMQLLQNKAMVESAIAEAQVHATLALAAAVEMVPEGIN